MTCYQLSAVSCQLKEEEISEKSGFFAEGRLSDVAIGCGKILVRIVGSLRRQFCELIGVGVSHCHERRDNTAPFCGDMIAVRVRDFFYKSMGSKHT